MIMRYLLIIPILFYSSAAVAYAQTPITIEQAAEKALSSNPAVDAARYAQTAAAQQRKAAAGLRLPQISLSGAYVRMDEDIAFDLNPLKQSASNILEAIGGSGVQLPPEVLSQAQALMGRDWTYTLQERGFASVGAGVSMPIYTGGKINAANRAARINESAAAEKGRQIRNSLMSELVERYYGLALAIEAVGVRQRAHEAMLEHLADARALEKNGMIARSERLYMEVKASAAERDLMSARLTERTLRDALVNTLGGDGDYTPASPMFVLTAIPDVGYFRDMAAGNNPQLRQVEYSRGLAVEAARAERAGFFPQIAAIGGTRLYDHNLNGHMPRWAVGVGVKFTIFDGLSREHKYAAARNTIRQVESLGDKARNDIHTLIGKLYGEMENYRDRIRSIESSLEFAEEYLRVQTTAFREGAASAADVTDAELNLAATRIDRLQAAYYYEMMLVRLLEAAGMDNEFMAYAQSAQAVYIN